MPLGHRAQALGEGVVGASGFPDGTEEGAGRRVRCVLPRTEHLTEDYVRVNINTKIYILLSAGAGNVFSNA